MIEWNHDENWTTYVEKWENSLWVIIKDRNSFCATKKVWWTSAPLLQTFFALHAAAVRLGSNGVKLQGWKVENTLRSPYAIIFLAS